MAWIKFEKDLLTDPRVLRIARNLQARWNLYEESEALGHASICNDVALPAVTLVCGALIRIWCLADTHLDENDILPLGFDELNEVVGIPGFCELLPQDWIKSLDNDSVQLPDFHKHNGTEAKKKAETQKRVERFRKRNAVALQPGNAIVLPDQTRPDQTNKKKKNLYSNEFEQFWAAYPKNKKVGKAAAAKKFAALNGRTDSTLPLILAALEWQKKSERWTKDGGQYVPDPERYLSKERWLDEPTGDGAQKEKFL